MNNITSNTPDTVIEGTPVNEIPKEIKEHYAKYGYWKRGIPFSAKTVKQIAKILESGEEEEKTADYDENMTFDKLLEYFYDSLWEYEVVRTKEACN